MARPRRTFGAGKMSAYLKTVADGPHIREAALEFAAHWNELFRRGGGNFGADTVKMMDEVAVILDGARDGPIEPQSTEDFAQRIATYHRKTAGLIARVPEPARRDADMAARLAFTCGHEYGLAVMQELWESHAIRGRNIFEALTDAGRRGNRKRQAEAAARRAEWQASADEIWSRNADWSRRAVAHRIAAMDGGNPDTIRRRIQKKVGTAR